jgi:hypothetical protein
MAVQALGVLESAWYANAGRVRRRAHVLKVNSFQAAHLVEQRAVQRVVGVAGDAGHVRRHPVILKVLRGNVLGVIYVQA